MAGLWNSSLVESSLASILQEFLYPILWDNKHMRGKCYVIQSDST